MFYSKRKSKLQVLRENIRARIESLKSRVRDLSLSESDRERARVCLEQARKYALAKMNGQLDQRKEKRCEES